MTKNEIVIAIIGTVVAVGVISSGVLVGHTSTKGSKTVSNDSDAETASGDGDGDGDGDRGFFDLFDSRCSEQMNCADCVTESTDFGDIACKWCPDAFGDPCTPQSNICNGDSLNVCPDGTSGNAIFVTDPCVDTRNWVNDLGDSCASYNTNNWCSNKAIQDSTKSGPDYNSPEYNCCNCGKPEETTTDTAFRAFLTGIGSPPQHSPRAYFYTLFARYPPALRAIELADDSDLWLVYILADNNLSPENAATLAPLLSAFAEDRIGTYGLIVGGGVLTVPVKVMQVPGSDTLLKPQCTIKKTPAGWSTGFTIGVDECCSESNCVMPRPAISEDLESTVSKINAVRLMYNAVSDMYPNKSVTKNLVEAVLILLPEMFPPNLGEEKEWDDTNAHKATSTQSIQEYVQEIVGPEWPNKRELGSYDTLGVAASYGDAAVSQMVFGSIGQGRVEKVRPNDVSKGTATYALYLDMFDEIPKQYSSYAKLGSIAYFTEDKELSHIVYDGTTYRPPTYASTFTKELTAGWCSAGNSEEWESTAFADTMLSPEKVCADEPTCIAWWIHTSGPLVGSGAMFSTVGFGGISSEPYYRTDGIFPSRSSVAATGGDQDSTTDPSKITMCLPRSWTSADEILNGAQATACGARCPSGATDEQYVECCSDISNPSQCGGVSCCVSQMDNNVQPPDNSTGEHCVPELLSSVSACGRNVSWAYVPDFGATHNRNGKGAPQKLSQIQVSPRLDTECWKRDPVPEQSLPLKFERDWEYAKMAFRGSLLITVTWWEAAVFLHLLESHALFKANRDSTLLSYAFRLLLTTFSYLPHRRFTIVLKI